MNENINQDKSCEHKIITRFDELRRLPKSTIRVDSELIYYLKSKKVSPTQSLNDVLRRELGFSSSIAGE